MNPYTKNLNRLEFVVTYACTGRCRHCSEGDHTDCGIHIDADAAAKAVLELAGAYQLTSLMTFGGEPLLYPDAVYAIHEAAREAGIPKRQLITNGFFSKNPAKIKEVCDSLADCGVNDVLLSADAFHQEFIPLDPVREFASGLRKRGVPLRMQPAWLVSRDDRNPYNRRTNEILAEFDAMGIPQNDGNVIFPSGNALKYLAGYFDTDQAYSNPYEDDPFDLRTVSVEPDGRTLDGCIYETGIVQILDQYTPRM